MKNDKTPPSGGQSLTLNDALQAGVQSYSSGNLAAAEHIFRLILKGEPNQPDALQLLGLVEMQKGELESAVKLMTTSLALAPNNAGVHSNLGGAYKRMGKSDEAIASYKRAIEVDPKKADSYVNLGVLYRDTKQLDSATDCFREACAIDPGNIKAGYYLAALTDPHTERPSNRFIGTIFDETASVFEENMVAGKSQLPDLTRQVAEGLGAGSANPFSTALDLGCGTGRSGVAFRDIVGTLHGVDLSQNMMKIAQEKGVYDALHLDDFTVFLEKSIDIYDLVMAVDAFLYSGPLVDVFSSVSKAMKTGGAFTFTVEALDEGDFALRASCRHAHSEAYIRRLAADYQFSISVCKPIDDMRYGIKGILFWLTKTN